MDLSTRDLFQKVISLLLKHTFMAHLTADLVIVEESLLEGIVDVDASWSIRPGKSSETASTAPSTIQTEILLDTEMLYDYDANSVGRSEPETPPTEGHTPSLRTMSTASIAMDGKAENSQRGASDLGSTLSHDRVHRGIGDVSGKWTGAVGYLLTTDPKLFATELTMMQWQIFSNIRVSKRET